MGEIVDQHPSSSSNSQSDKMDGGKEVKKFDVPDNIVHVSPRMTIPPRESTFHQTAFNAYPLNASSQLLGPQHEVIYMPLSPFDCSSALPPVSQQVTDPSSTVMHDFGHPIFHGFIFPHSTNGVNEESSDIQVLQNTQNSINQCSSHIPEEQLHPQMFDDIEQNAQIKLQLLLLQQLISLQLSQQASISKNTFDNTTSSTASLQQPLPNQPQLEPTEAVTEFEIPSGNPSSNKSNMSTFLVPVEAELVDDCGLSLRITPRDEDNNSVQGSPVTMPCPNEPFVLYPYTVQCKNTVENMSSESVFNELGLVGQTAQTLTMNDIRNCIRRGSLDVDLDQNRDIVDCMKGQTKSGFVLLSIRHEKIAPHNGHTLVRTESTPLDIHSPQQFSPDCPVNSKTLEVQKKPLKKRPRHSKSETELRKRAVRSSSKSLMKAFDDDNVFDTSFGLTEEDVRVLAMKSRFRVTRFADKRQYWIAPSEAGCFTVHDLWTTKLPDYVLKRMEQMKTLKADFFDSSNLSYSFEQVLDAHCVACAQRPPKACDCAGDVRLYTSKSLPSNLQIS